MPTKATKIEKTKPTSAKATLSSITMLGPMPKIGINLQLRSSTRHDNSAMMAMTDSSIFCKMACLLLMIKFKEFQFMFVILKVYIS